MKTRILSSIFLFLLLGLTGLQAQEASTEVLEKPEGMILDRDDETQLQVNMEGGRLVVRVLDMEYQPLPDVFVKGYGEVDPRGKKSEKLVMRPNSEGDGLENLKFIRPPHVFKVRLYLFTSEDVESKEVYIFDYNQFAVAEEAGE